MATKRNARPSEHSISKEVLDYYREPGSMTSPGKYAKALRELSNDIPAIAKIVQGLAIHQFVAEFSYSVKIPPSRESEGHIRFAEELIDKIFTLDNRPLSTARPPGKRVAGVCHHFARLFLTILRTKGIPARARCGQGTYFNPGFFEDHVLVEYWNETDARWVRVDAQFDDVWQKGMHQKHDVLDVPHDHFLIAGDAWALARSGKADPNKMGIFQGDLRGLWFVAGALVRDLAMLNKVEMLQWDVWGAIPQPHQKLSDTDLKFFDHLAELTRHPDQAFKEIRSLYDSDERLKVPGTVFNAMLQRPETVSPSR